MFFFSLRRGLRAPAVRVLGGIWFLSPVGQSGGLLAGLLLAGHCALGALAGAGVGLGPLASHRKAAAVPDPLVTADLDLAADVRCDLAAEVTLELVVALEEVTK